MSYWWVMAECWAKIDTTTDQLWRREIESETHLGQLLSSGEDIILRKHLLELLSLRYLVRLGFFGILIVIYLSDLLLIRRDDVCLNP